MNIEHQRRHDLIAQAISTPEGREKLADDMWNMGRPDIRKLFYVQPMPHPALPIYDPETPKGCVMIVEELDEINVMELK